MTLPPSLYKGFLPVACSLFWWGTWSVSVGEAPLSFNAETFQEKASQDLIAQGQVAEDQRPQDKLSVSLMEKAMRVTLQEKRQSLGALMARLYVLRRWEDARKSYWQKCVSHHQRTQTYAALILRRVIWQKRQDIDRYQGVLEEVLASHLASQKPLPQKHLPLVAFVDPEAIPTQNGA